MFITTFIANLEIDLFRRWRDGDVAAGDALSGLFFDLQYLRKFGIPLGGGHDIPPLVIDPLGNPPPPIVTDDGLVAAPSAPALVLEVLRKEVLALVAGDPSPQPSLVAMLRDPVRRLKSAKSLRTRLRKAHKALDEEIERLDQTLESA